MKKEKLTPEEKLAQKQLRIEEKAKNKELVANNKQLINEKQLENKQYLEEVKSLRAEDKVKKLEDLNQKLLAETNEEEKQAIEAKIKEYEKDQFPDPVKAKIARRKIDRNNQEIAVLKKANSALSPWIFTRNIVILATIAIIMGGAIGLTNFITAPIIKENERKAKFKAYETIYPNATFSTGDELENYNLLTEEDKDSIKDVVFVFEDEQFVGVVYSAGGKNQYGNIKILIAITPENKIKQVSILENTNTPGFGDKAATHIVDQLLNQDYNKTPDAYSGA
ncbi:MAG: FMN-binding protein, partial [Acholeplasmataceae bacterium]|nr:FMN-binding protein [Acholeplasmataceae bacterium]